MQFIYQPLTWGFLLVLLPLLIHLINMMRHRRVQWAAMDFLLASYRKHRRWVWLKQFMLLLLRMLAIAAVVAMLAKLVTDNQLGRFFGQKTTHHFVLIDDSLSMSQRTGSGSAFDRGRQLVQRLAASARTSDEPQRLTLIRYSRAARAGQNAAPEEFADLNAVPVNDSLAKAWEEQGDQFRVSQLAVTVEPALNVAEQLVENTQDQRCLLHIVSDFRRTDWDQAASVRETLARLEKTDTEIHLLQCVDQASSNLAVTTLRPDVGTQAAGVPLMMTVQVQNLSPQAVDQVKLKTRSVFHPTSAQGIESTAEATELPDLLIERIEAGATLTRQFQVFFNTPGSHVVEVALPTDAIEADNRRWCVVELESGESALIVDSDPEEKAAYYLESIFRPGSKAKTGVVPSVQPIRYLRDATLEQLGSHHAIYLLDPPPLDASTLEKLRLYVQQGGGLTVFVGPNFNLPFYSNWYESGVFPVALQRLAAYDPEVSDQAADVQFEDHPIFRALLGARNPFAAAIRIQRYIATATNWNAPPDSGIDVLAKLRNGAPLVAHRSVGDGQVVAFLTTLAPDWNNWVLEPSFIVVALQLHAHLALPQRPRVDRQVGETITLQVDTTQYEPELKFMMPGTSPELPVELTKTAESTDDGPDGTLLTTSLGPAASAQGMAGETDMQGIYEVQLATRDNRTLHQRFALNVDPRESQLDVMDRNALRSLLEPIDVRIHRAEDQFDLSGNVERNSWSEFLLWFLIVALLIEQYLAYRLSYHAYAMQPAGGTS
jgi:hypothetical protein